MTSKYKITIFESVTDTKGRHVSVDWARLERMAKKPYARKEDMPLIKMGRFAGMRRNDNLKTISGVELDYDGGVMSIDEAKRRLRTAWVDAILYETPSSTPEAPRWRVLAPLAHEATANEREQLVKRLNGVLDGVVATESFTPAQIFYIGALRGSKGGYRQTRKGLGVDQRVELDAGAIGKSDAPKAVTKKDGVDRSAVLQAIAADCVKRGLRLSDFNKAWRESEDATAHVMKHSSEALQKRAVRRAWKWATENVESAFQNVESDVVETPRERFLSADDLRARPRPNDFVEDLLYEGLMSVWYGAPKSGKSFLILDLACHVALGKRWADKDVEKRGVLIVPLEGEGLLRDRVTAWEKHNVAKCEVMFSPFPLNLATGADRIKEIIEYAKANDIGLIIVDTLARAMIGSDDSSYKDMSAAIAGADRIRHATGAHVLIVHHTTKDKKGPRGSGDIIGAPDLVVEVAKLDPDARQMKITENRNGSEGTGVHFKIEQIDTGAQSRRGKPILSGAVSIHDKGFVDMDEQDEKAGARDHLATLARLWKNADMIGFDDRGVPASDWRHALDRRGLGSEAQKDSTRRSHFKRMKDRLVQAGLVLETDGYFKPSDRGQIQ